MAVHCSLNPVGCSRSNVHRVSASRMPPRKKQKTVHNVIAQDPQAGNPGASSSESATAPSWKGTKSRRTSLEKFIDGPVDIVVEVLAWLHPRDLCTLVRTSSVFKHFLLTKGRRQLWKTVIANATDLPPKPPWLSEPAFVHLLYSHHCHNCGTAARQAITGWFKRVCSKCIPEVSVTWSDAWRSIRALDQRKGSEMNMIFDLVLNGKQPSYMTPIHVGLREQAYRCSKTDVGEYLERLRKIKRNPDRKARENAHEAIVKEWKQRLKQRQKYSALLKAWCEKEEQNRRAELGDKRGQRFTEIIKRLQESEWAKEIEFLSAEEVREMAMFPVVRRSCKLTKGEWSSVLVALDDFLNETRERRLSAEREAVIRSRLHQLESAILEHYVQLPRTAAMDVRPDYIQFALMDKCKALADAPVEQTVTRDNFLAILPELHKRWHTTAKVQLVKAVQRHLRTPSISITTRDPLNLAVVVFLCEHCRPFACMRYPAVLAHVCGYTNYYDDWSDPDQPNRDDLYTTVARQLRIHDDDELYQRERFSLSNVVGAPEDSYRKKVLEPMCTIVRALGLDPSTATAVDLDACDARLRCATCVAQGGGPDAIYGWDAALFHYHQFGRHHAQWERERVDGAEMDKVRELEAARDARKLNIHSIQSTWACSLCADWDGSGNAIKAHLSHEHGLSDPDACVRDGTIYVHPAKNTVLMRSQVVLPLVQRQSSSGPKTSA